MSFRSLSIISVYCFIAFGTLMTNAPDQITASTMLLDGLIAKVQNGQYYPAASQIVYDEIISENPSIRDKAARLFIELLKKDDALDSFDKDSGVNSIIETCLTSATPTTNNILLELCCELAKHPDNISYKLFPGDNKVVFYKNHLQLVQSLHMRDSAQIKTLALKLCSAADLPTASLAIALHVAQKSIQSSNIQEQCAAFPLLGQLVSKNYHCAEIFTLIKPFLSNQNNELRKACINELHNFICQGYFWDDIVEFACKALLDSEPEFNIQRSVTALIGTLVAQNIAMEKIVKTVKTFVAANQDLKKDSLYCIIVLYKHLAQSGTSLDDALQIAPIGLKSDDIEIISETITLFKVLVDHGIGLKGATAVLTQYSGSADKYIQNNIIKLCRSLVCQGCAIDQVHDFAAQNIYNEINHLTAENFYEILFSYGRFLEDGHKICSYFMQKGHTYFAFPLYAKLVAHYQLLDEATTVAQTHTRPNDYWYKLLLTELVKKNRGIECALSSLSQQDDNSSTSSDRLELLTELVKKGKAFDQAKEEIENYQKEYDHDWEYYNFFYLMEALIDQEQALDETAEAAASIIFANKNANLRDYSLNILDKIVKKGKGLAPALFALTSESKNEKFTRNFDCLYRDICHKLSIPDTGWTVEIHNIKEAFAQLKASLEQPIQKIEFALFFILHYLLSHSNEGLDLALDYLVKPFDEQSTFEWLNRLCIAHILLSFDTGLDAIQNVAENATTSSLAYVKECGQFLLDELKNETLNEN